MRIDLEFPIEAPGGSVATVFVRRFTPEERDIGLASLEGEMRVFSAAIGLPVELAGEVVDIDHRKIVQVWEMMIAADRLEDKIEPPRLYLVEESKI